MMQTIRFDGFPELLAKSLAMDENGRVIPVDEAEDLRIRREAAEALFQARMARENRAAAIRALALGMLLAIGLLMTTGRI